MQIGEALRKKRQEAGLSLTKLSSATGMSVAALSKYESGKLKVRVDQLPMLARALGLTPVQLAAAIFEQDGEE